jgi:hypothetical protein
MAYIINKYNGDQAAVVDDGTINTTLDLKLIGKNYAGYGEAQNENYTWLLENFASQTAPPKAIVGQLWYDTSEQKLKLNNGTGKWRTLGVVEIVANNSVAKITDLETGDLFWNTTNEQLWCKSATENVLIGGKLIGISTAMKASSVLADDGTTYEIIEAIINNVTTFVISSESAAFTLDPTEDLTAVGYLDIYPGITIKGINSTAFTSDTYQLWGTVSDSQRLDGYEASEYINKTLPIFPNLANFADTGLSIGAAPNERLLISIDGSTPTFYNQSNSTITFKTTELTLPKYPMKLVGQNIIPGNADNSNIGSPTEKFNTVYATTFEGNATSADGVTLDGVAKLASAAADPDTVVVRTNDIIEFGGVQCTAGSITATYFIGNAFLGNGDIAEKYLADAVYDVGTVMMIGGDNEVTAATSGHRAIGTVSQDPAYLMNASLEGGIAIALKGRVPVKVVGKVTKGDRLISTDSGVARSYTTADDSSFVFAVALDSSEFEDIKIVEALVL